MRRRRNSATILRLLQDMRAGILSESENLDNNEGPTDRNNERVILINPFDQTIIVQGSYDSNDSQNRAAPIGSRVIICWSRFRIIAATFVGERSKQVRNTTGSERGGGSFTGCENCGDTAMYQLPCDESKLDLEGSRNNSISNEESNNNGNNNVGNRNESGRQFSVPLPWPFSGLFSSSGSRSSGGNSTSGSSTNANASTSREDEN
ncbi:hypothetical protein DH2020_021838 [Rehmannia glutinosa]|uniref:Uncharacterized protein n=1 Tax=Rehmannia glutinosa TaxID=99300 RepID=A0ABR0WC09_REHGL